MPELGDVKERKHYVTIQVSLIKLQFKLQLNINKMHKYRDGFKRGRECTHLREEDILWPMKFLAIDIKSFITFC